MAALLGSGLKPETKCDSRPGAVASGSARLADHPRRHRQRRTGSSAPHLPQIPTLWSDQRPSAVWRTHAILRHFLVGRGV